MAHQIDINDHIPPFQAHDQEGNIVTDEDLLGSPVVIYFYPKDDTPGCTKEACSFRDQMEFFDDVSTLVIGVSPDGAQSHQKFMNKHDLNFTLLCDENYELCRKFGVLKEKNVDGKTSYSVERSTFLIDSDGTVQWIERNVDVFGHTDRVFGALKEHCIFE